MPTMRFTPVDLAVFAAASHDHNPLHVSPDYARKTPFGEPVVFGALGALAAVGASPGRPGRALSRLALTFRNPMVCGVDYDLTLNGGKADRLKFTVEDAGRVVTTGTLDFRPRVGVDSEPWFSATDPVPEAEERSAEGLRPGLEVAGQYGPDPESFRALVGRWGLNGKGVAPAQVAALLWCSYLVGMRLPGTRAVFSQLRIAFEPDSAAGPLPLSYAARVADFDERFDLLSVDADLRVGDAPFATAGLSSFVRRDSPSYSRTRLAGLLPASQALAGKTALVIGGSRGLGAALVAAVASQGCDVLLNYQSSEAEALGLQDRLRGGPGRVTLARGDACDPDWCRKLRGDLDAEGRAVDLLICNASPALTNLGFGLGSVDRIRAFLDRGFAATCVPMAGFLGGVAARGGWVVVISSAVADPAYHDFPPDWPHYLATKYAVEGLVRAVAAQTPGAHFLVVRPPRLLTDQTNTTNGRLGAVAVDEVAAEVVRRLRAPAGPATLEVLDLASVTG
jgi:NAD(P)-dependent dehydrogenase (short-subunit alcohol dehydrogenase family)